jgi:prepilin-type N-terminal cleavage/methylation domain-containing protein
MSVKHRNFNKGFTLIELLAAVGIFLVIGGAGYTFFITALRSQTTVWDSVAAQSDAKRAIQQVVRDVRRADTSSIGAYSINTTNTSTLIIYANVDNDGLVERVRYWLDGRIFKKGIIKPTGNPLEYLPQNELVTEMVHDVINFSERKEVFLYFDGNYTGTGTSTPLAQPVTATNVRLIKVQLDIEKSPDRSPQPIRVESMSRVRNLAQ